jgi:flagellar biosynthetic protein FliO
MTARLLTTLALALPLAACAAQPGSGQAAGQESRPVVRAPAAVEPAPAAAPTAAPAAAAEPAATPAPQATKHVPQVTSSPAPAPASAHPRAVAGTGAPSAAAPAQVPAQAPAQATISQPDTAAAPTGTAVPANPAAPDVVAPRPATPGVTVPPVAMPAGSSTGSLLQTLFALILVLAVLGALAWFLKRYGPKVGGGNANLRVVGSLNLGGRERIVVVEVGNEWIVVGASPGRINALATMPRQDGQNGATNTADAALAPHAPAAHSFADWLKQTIDKRK